MIGADPFARSGLASRLNYEPASVLACVLFALLALLVATAPIRLFNIQLPLVWAVLIPVFVLALIHPGRRSLVLSFTMGLGFDLVLAGPVGPFALGFTWAYVLTTIARPALEGGGWGEYWAAFAMAAATCGISAYMLAGFALQLAGPVPVLPDQLIGLGEGVPAATGYRGAQMFSQWLFTVAFAPLFLMVFGGFERLRLGRRRR